MKLTYKYLKSRIINNRWMGKDVLEIGEDIISMTNRKLNNISPFRAIINSDLAAMVPIKSLAEEALLFSDLSVISSLLTLETCYGINRAFNSKTHKNSSSYGQSKLNSTLPSDNDKYFYSQATEVWNETLNIPTLDTDINEIRTSIKSSVGDVQSSISNKVMSFQEKFGIGFIETQIESVKSLAEASEGKVESRLRTQLSRLRKLFKSMQPIDNFPVESSFSSGSINYISPKILPRLTDVVEIVNKLASWFLSIFSIPSGILEALSYAVTSVVCKAIGSVGANACRYLAAGVFKSSPQLVPAIASSSGTLFAGVWATLSAYAPYIAIIGLLILVAIKWSKQTELGDFIYLLGTKPIIEGRIPDPDLGFATVAEMNEAEIRSYILEFANRMIDEGRTTYENFWAFVLNDDNQITLCLDLKNLSAPIPVKDEAIISSLWGSFGLFLDEFSED